MLSNQVFYDLSGRGHDDRGKEGRKKYGGLRAEKPLRSALVRVIGINSDVLSLSTTWHSLAWRSIFF
jgi:hypothetical protein